MRRFSFISFMAMCLWYIAMNTCAANNNSNILIKPDFAQYNQFGDSILYRFIKSAPATVCVSQMMYEELLYNTDSLVIPDYVHYEGKDYSVTNILWWAFFNAPLHVKSITLPQTYTGVCTDEYIFDELNIFNPFTYSSPFENIYVHKDNPFYLSEQGVLYTKDKKVIVAYPPNKGEDVFILEEGVCKIGNSAFACAKKLQKLIVPNSLKEIEEWAICNTMIDELVIQDSVSHISKNALAASFRKITLGRGIKEIHCEAFSRLNKNRTLDIVCYSEQPPYITPRIINGVTDNKDYSLSGHEYISLQVPRKALAFYQQAAGWKDCASILPIEPPIVTGAENAEVSWVQNFSATGYEWVLYADEARTQEVMTLVFNASGTLTELRLGDGFMPAPAAQRMTAAVQEDGDTDDDMQGKRYAEYYSFNITGLRPGTTYWYSCRSLADGNVIEEDKGLFSTLSEGGTGTGPGLVLNGQPGNGRNTAPPFKTIENGLLYIHRDNRTYTPCGWKVK